jgi:hypothetical protein
MNNTAGIFEAYMDYALLSDEQSCLVVCKLDRGVDGRNGGQ